jgi:Uracil phosphoribosyltransferase
VDEGLSDKGYILPGMGNYSDRYFGTDIKEDDDEEEPDTPK